MPSETIIGSGAGGASSGGASSGGGGSAQAAASRLLDSQGDAIKSAAAQTDQIIDSIRRQPVTAALVIFGIGYLIGKIT